MTEDRNDRPSRSARKREAQAIEELARQLVELPETTGRKLPLSPELQSELQLARATRGHSSRDRQIRHLAALLRGEEDLSPLIEFLSRQDQHAWAERQRFHQLEVWRDRLCRPSDYPVALAEIKTALPRIDAERLARLAARVHQQNDRHAAREIFRLLREAAS